MRSYSHEVSRMGESIQTASGVVVAGGLRGAGCRGAPGLGVQGEGGGCPPLTRHTSPSSSLETSKAVALEK